MHQHNSCLLTIAYRMGLSWRLSILLLAAIVARKSNAWLHLMTRKDAITSSFSAAGGLFISQSLTDSSSQAATTQPKNSENGANNLTEEERREILERIKARRQLMEASRSSNNRQSYLDLSRQRAALYNTTSRAVSCPPNIPCF